MIGLENLSPEIATDLIGLVNSLQKLQKSSNVKYYVQNKKTGEWNTKEFNYVPLDDILEKIKENGNFAFMQPIGFDKESQVVGIKCVLVHKSGKYLESDVFPIKTKEDMKIQDEGAEITYRKRYAAGAFFGIATEEDTDGNDPEASQKEERKATPRQIENLKMYYKGNALNKLLEENKITKIEDISLKKASDLIQKINELKEKNRMMNDLVRYENDQMLIDDEAVKQIVKFERNALKINILKEQIREQALAKMEELGIDKYVSPDGSLTINYFPERTSKRLDSTKLKKELPDIYEEYLKDSTTKSYVKLTVK